MKGVQDERIHQRNDIPSHGKTRYVLYWMQQSQRVRYNHTLEFAVNQANRLGLPIRVVFGLTESYPHANRRHYVFMLEGLKEVSSALRERGISFGIHKGSPDRVALEAARHAALLVCDKGYLRHQRQWRRNVAGQAPCSVVEVDCDVVVPVTSVSNKAEYAARTIRPRIHRLLPRFLTPLRAIPVKIRDIDLDPAPDIPALLKTLDVDTSVQAVSGFFRGGYAAASNRLQHFLRFNLPSYHQVRRQLHLDDTTMLSPWLHFGQISALEIALAVGKADAPPEAREAFLEQLIVRRELAVNHAIHQSDYDRYAGLPEWARASLEAHTADPRNPSYPPRILVTAQTHDPYWNAAMMEMKVTGYMHNYMRMYWGKKILQWSTSPQAAFKTLLRLNDTYFIDGRDPNSYAGVGWIFGLHDRPWKERAIYGKVRYMARSGLERKFDMQGYIDKVSARIATGKGAEP